MSPHASIRRAACAGNVGTPDSVQALAILADGSRATYHFSGVTRYGQSMDIHLFGTDGTIHYDFLKDRIFAAGKKLVGKETRPAELQEIPIPPEKSLTLACRGRFRRFDPPRACRYALPDFATGVAYMEFTEAVARMR